MNTNLDLKEIVKSSYHIIINGALQKIFYLQIDNILKDLTGLYIDKKELGIKYEEISIFDLFPIYNNIWKSTLELLYQSYLPEIEYKHSWKIEITPYTLMICEITKDFTENKEISIFKQLLSNNNQTIEYAYQNIIKMLDIENIFADIPNDILPETTEEKLSLLSKLMNFPPLGELALFYYQYNATLINKTKDLSTAFSTLDSSKIPSFPVPQQLTYSYFHIDHSTFHDNGLDEIEKIPELSTYKKDFDEIKRLAKSEEGTVQDNYICPCCGEEQKINVPITILQYKHLIKNQQIARKAGLIYYNKFTENYKKNISKAFASMIPSLNKVKDPSCLILVEGDSEEVSIPILALKTGFFLSQNNIQVYNSKSKEKLCADFFNIKDKYPSRKMICLLDSDALKEKQNLERIVNKNKDKYRLLFIEKGTFEDIFNIDDSIKVINELYPNGEEVKISDFDKSKDFLQNIKRILYVKKKATFDKVLFAKKISLEISSENTPKIVLNMLDIAKKFARPKVFIRE